MNVFDEIREFRPEVGPFDAHERRRIRESLFGIGHDGSRSDVRSESGAVVSTAPHGTRRSMPTGPRSDGSWTKAAAGLLVVALLGAGAWALVGGGDTVETVVDTVRRPTSPTTTEAPATTVASVRTGVTTDRPLVLPPRLLSVDEALIEPDTPGSSFGVFSAPDGTEIWMAELDGEPSSIDGLALLPTGSITVGVPIEPIPGAPQSYRPQVPCGVVIVNDAVGEDRGRPEMGRLLEAVRLVDGRIDVQLPTDFTLFSAGDGVRAFTTQFQIPGAGGSDTLRVTQAPGGSLAQLMFGGRQVEAIDFVGRRGFLAEREDVAGNSETTVLWRDGDTAFRMSSPTLSLGFMEEFAAELEPVTVDAWVRRFPSADGSGDAPDVQFECSPQPRLGPTLDP